MEMELIEVFKEDENKNLVFLEDNVKKALQNLIDPIIVCFFGSVGVGKIILGHLFK